VSSAPSPAEQPQPIVKSIWQRLSLSEIAALSVGFLYVSGYFINSIFVRNLGIPDTELLRLEYIKTGFTFALTLGFVYLPISAFALTYKVRRSSGLPHLHTGAVGNSLNTSLFLAFPLFLAFFITRYEWEMALPSRQPLHPIPLHETNRLGQGMAMFGIFALSANTEVECRLPRNGHP
jgi:hypothetical protein